MKHKILSVRYLLKSKFEKFRVSLCDVFNLMMAGYLDIQDIESVCLALGPYRNLTTLTASVLFLHPNCQVLNHAGNRVFNNRSINFLWDYSQDKFDRFIRFAVKISGKGQRGTLGGSITYSHAFDSQYEMKKTFAKTGLGLTKKQIKCLFWKEPLRTSNMIRDRHVDFADIFEREDRLRFLLPIRHPLDCAVSNMKTGHFNDFRVLGKNPSIYEVVQAVLDEIFWFADLKKRFPDRFFYFFEHEISRKMLVNLSEFLQLNPDEAWVTNAISVMKIKSGYKHDDEVINFYRGYVCDKGSLFPSLTEGLLVFID